jgi:hypothetical protein
MFYLLLFGKEKKRERKGINSQDPLAPRANMLH